MGQTGAETRKFPPRTLLSAGVSPRLCSRDASKKSTEVIRDKIPYKRIAFSLSGDSDSALHPRGIAGHQHRALGWRLGGDSHCMEREGGENVTAPQGLHSWSSPGVSASLMAAHPQPTLHPKETQPKGNVPEMSLNPPLRASKLGIGQCTPPCTSSIHWLWKHC